MWGRRVRGGEAPTGNARGTGSAGGGGGQRGGVAGGAIRTYRRGGGARRRSASRVGWLRPSGQLSARPLALQLWCVPLASRVTTAACPANAMPPRGGEQETVNSVTDRGCTHRKQEVGQDRGRRSPARSALPQCSDLRGSDVHLWWHLKWILHRSTLL